MIHSPYGLSPSGMVRRKYMSLMTGRDRFVGNLVTKVIARLFDFVPIWDVPSQLEYPLQSVLGQLLQVKGLSLLSYILLTLTTAGMFHLMESAEVKAWKERQN